MSQSTATSTSKNSRQLAAMSLSKRQSDEAKGSMPFNQSVWESDPDSYHKLEVAMKCLSRVDKDAVFYIETSQKIMQHLHQEFQKGEEAFLPWVRFFDISTLKKENYVGKKEGSQGYLFRQGMEDLIVTIFNQNQVALAIDWRIAKKMLSVPNIFPEQDNSRLLPLIAKEALLRAFQIEIDRALGQMIWLNPTNLTALAKRTLQILQESFNDKSYKDLFGQAIIVGRFDKSKFDLQNSLILGEDGGLYLLLNRLTKDQQAEMVLENIVTTEYLKDKIKRNLKKPEEEETKKKELGDRVVLGQGGFGKVKFALSLFGGKASTGDVICIKKTKNFLDLAPKHGELTTSPLHEATEATMEDYFASSIADKVYAPHIFDLAIVAARDPKELSLVHQKGYLMMEVFPQNTATKIFKESKYQKWKYQKPFLQEVMLATCELLKERIAFTDLKPDNALFDTDTFKTTIIDLGGTIRIEAADSIEKFDKSKYSFQITLAYCAPEMNDTNMTTINLPKALAYTCGVVMEEVVEKSDYDRNKLKGLIDKLTDPTPDRRITIEEALKCLKEMGDDTTNEDILLNQYIAKIKERIENNRSSISLNEDILTTKELYIDLKITPRDPEKYKGQDTEDLFKRVDRFLAVEQNQQQIMAIFGSAGSGKSIALQLKFIEAIQKWEKGQPLPIYFNLANGIDLKSIINSMNTELGTNLKLQELKNNVYLYIDSFDEGLEIEKKRETLIKDYMAELKTDHAKILITCRSSYLESESNQSWFTPKFNAFSKLAIYYVAPMNYVTEEKAGKSDSGWKERVTYYLERQSKTKGIQMNQEDLEETLKKMAVMNLDKLLDTGLMFSIVFEVLPELLADGSQSRGRSKQDVYLKYVTKYQKEELEKLTEEQKAQVLEYTKFISKSQEKEFTLIKAIRYLGKYLAVQLHLKDKFRLDQDAPIFQAVGYESTTHFKKQVLWHILKLLPLKIETKHSNNPSQIKSQEVKLGFIHDTIKNCYLLDAIQDEMSTQNGISQILSSKNIIADRELVKFIADAAYYDDALKTYLRKAIDLAKSDKSVSAEIYAANCITILVSARHSFRGQDLSDINIKSANLENGIFSGANFTGADLSHASLRGIQASSATFRRTNLNSAKLGILPDLVGHKFSVTSVSFSGDGKYVASGSQDQTVKIWEVETNKCMATLEGHTGEVRCVSFAGDGRYIASGSKDEKIKIWDVQTQKCIATLEGYAGYMEEGVTSVSFSADGRYVASTDYEEQTVKIWEVQTQNCIATLEGHGSTVNSVTFSGDGRYVASGSKDKTVKIWEVQTQKCIATFQGHTDYVNSVSFSGDERYVASGSRGDIVIWEVQTQKHFATLQAKTGILVESVSFSGDGRYVASSGSENTVQIWEVQTQKCLATLQGHLWPVSSVSFSADGRYVASGSYDSRVKIWEFSNSTNNLIAIGGHSDSVTSVSFSGDGRYVVSRSSDKTVKIWEIQNNKCIATLEGQTRSASFTGDGKCVASGSSGKTINIWEVQSNKCIATLEGHTDHVYMESFSGDGRYLASGSSDKTIKIWEVQTQKCIATLEGRANEIRSVSFSGDGRYVAWSDGSDKTVKIWEILTQKCIATLQGRIDIYYELSVSLSSDGRYIASGSSDQTIKIWDVQTQKCIATLQGHTWYVNSVNFSCDGRYLASGSKDESVKIWEVQTQKCIATLLGHKNEVHSVSFSSDGRYLASGSSDKTVAIWVNSNGSWLLDTLLSDSEPPLRIREAIIEETSISVLNQTVLQQRGAQLKNNSTAKDTVIEMELNSDAALLTADKLNDQLLKIQITTHKKLKQRKLIQIDTATLLKQIEQNQKNKKEALLNKEKAGQETVVAHQRKVDGPVELSSTIQANSDSNKASVSLKELQISQIQSGDKKMNGKKQTKSACCNIF